MTKDLAEFLEVFRPELEALCELWGLGAAVYGKDGYLQRGGGEHHAHALAHLQRKERANGLDLMSVDEETGKADTLHCALRCLIEQHWLRVKTTA